MTTEMFGAPVGIEAAAQTRREMALTGLKEDELEGQRRFMAAMQGLAQPGMQQQSMPDMLDKAATLAMGAGQVEKASELSGRSAMVRERMAMLAHTNALNQADQVQAGRRKISVLSQLMQGVGDQQSWDRANTMFRMMTGQSSPYEGMPYSDGLKKQLSAQGMTASDAAGLELKKQNLAALDEVRKSTEAFRTKRLEIMERQQKLREQQADVKAKFGGKALGAPSKDEQMNAAQMVQEEFPNLPEEERQQASYTVASRARALRQANPGLDAATSLHQALAEAKENQDFQQVNRMFGLWKSTHFQQQGPWVEYQQGGEAAAPTDMEDAE